MRKASGLDGERTRRLRHAVRLQVFSISWDVMEGAVAVTAGVMAGSTTLMGFGLESAIEVVSAGAVYWRLRQELRRGEFPDKVERRALRIVAVAFLILSAYVGVEAVTALVRHEAPEASALGMGMAAASLVVMPILAVAKRRTGRALESEAMVADSRETIASTYLAFTVLAGLGLTALFSWWWSDSVAALLMIPYLLWAARGAWEEARR